MQRECALEGATALQNMQMRKGASQQEGGESTGAAAEFLLWAKFCSEKAAEHSVEHGIQCLILSSSISKEKFPLVCTKIHFPVHVDGETSGIKSR